VAVGQVAVVVPAGSSVLSVEAVPAEAAAVAEVVTFVRSPALSRFAGGSPGLS